MTVNTSDGIQFESLAEAIAHYAVDNKVQIVRDNGRTYIALYGEIDINDEGRLPYANLPERLVEVE